MEKITLTLVIPPGQRILFPGSGNLAIAMATRRLDLHEVRTMTFTGYYHEFIAYVDNWIMDLELGAPIHGPFDDSHLALINLQQIHQLYWMILSLGLDIQRRRIMPLIEAFELDYQKHIKTKNPILMPRYPQNINR